MASCTSFNINDQTPFHLYTTSPFPGQQIKMVNPCGTIHPGKDITFDGASFGTPLFAMESGTVLWVTSNVPLCTCVVNTTCNCPTDANAIGIQSDVDGVITEYVHVNPEVKVNDHVTAGQRIATLAASGTFFIAPGGSPLPHVHITRYVTVSNQDICNSVLTCNWDIQGLNSQQPQPQLPPCQNGWSIVNGEWKFCQNGVGQGGWNGAFFSDPTGVWAGFIRQENGTIQFRPRVFRTLPSTDPLAGTILKGDFACSLGQWWFFDNNGNLASNNIVGFNPLTNQWTLGQIGQNGGITHRLDINGQCLDCGQAPCSPPT